MTAWALWLLLGQIYVWTDKAGEQHFTDDLSTVPKGVKVRTSTGEPVSVVPAAPRAAVVRDAGVSSRPAVKDDVEAAPTVVVEPLPPSLKPGDERVLREAVDAAVGAARLAAVGGLRRSVHLEVLDSVTDVQRLGAPEWAGGFCTGPTRIYLLSPYIGLSSGGRPRPWNEMALHELAHALLRQWAGSTALPRWFNEGFAMYVAGQDPYAAPSDIAWWAIRFGGERPLTNTWSTPSTTRPPPPLSQVTFAYGVSNEGVRFFATEFGEPSLKALLHALHEGLPFEAAFQRASGVELREFERRFIEHLRPSFHDRAE